jgi:predicted ATP-dependent serine protease
MTRVIKDQAAGLRGLAALRTSDTVRILTIAGGKSGVGKTSVVVNLAMTLAKNGKQVLILEEILGIIMSMRISDLGHVMTCCMSLTATSH